MTPLAINSARAVISRFSTTKLKDMADEALRCKTAEEVENIVAEVYKT